MMNHEELPLARKVRQEILFARPRVYQAGQATPLDIVEVEHPFQLYLKREDMSPIRAYKWRGAYNRMALLSAEERSKGVVAASAGNHAQGVALAASLLKTTATIYMPRSTPTVKQSAVKKHGGGRVEIILAGDSYDQAYAAAQAFSKERGTTYIHAYDDIHVMGGQGTIADEIIMSGHGPFDVAFLQVGGGGMAAAVACWLKTHNPDIKIIGIEAEGQDSMQAAIKTGSPTQLDALDIFCDGTAVRQVGQHTFELCKELIDEWVTVSKTEVREAIYWLWDHHRCVSETSGAMGIAAVMKQADKLSDQKVLTVLTGANIDFSQLGAVASSIGSSQGKRQYVRIEINEQKGEMLRLLDDCMKDIDIIDFQYGKTDPNSAWPIFGVAASDQQFAEILERLERKQYSFEKIENRDDVDFRAIPYRIELMSHPLFLKLEFYERPGALHDFLNERARNQANFCYFNYNYSGERVGRALLGFEFDSSELRDQFLANLPAQGSGYRQCHPVSPEVFGRLTASYHS